MSPDPYWIASPPSGAILQSELLSNVIEFRVKIETIGISEQEEFEEIIHPLAIVMTQDCDLDLDHRARYEGGAAHRQIDSISLCEADDAAAMRELAGIKSKAWSQVQSHQNERFQVLQSVPEAIAERRSLPPAVAGGAGATIDEAATEHPPHGWRRWFTCLSRTRPAPLRPAMAGPGHVALDARFRGTIGLDFRRVFTMPTGELHRRIEIGEARRHCYLSPVYRDHLSNRFYGYHMRVALEEREQPE